MNRSTAAALVVALSVAPALSEVVVFEEGFGTPDVLYCDPAFPASWTLQDEDGRTPNKNVGYVTAAWVTLEDDFDSSNCAAVSTSWYDPVGLADDWMITPEIHVPEGATLSWRAYSPLGGEDADDYEVRYSTTGTIVPTDFDGNLLLAVVDEATTWTERSVSLASLAGHTIHLAFRNDSFDDYLLYVDDVRVTLDDTLLSEEFGSNGGGNLCTPVFPAGWITHDVDGEPVTTTYDWITEAWVAADTSPLDPSDCAAFSTSLYDSPAQADDWLVTPLLAVPSPAELRWEATAGSALDRDGYEVRYSTGGSDPADFTANAPLFTLSAENPFWTERSVDLDAAGLGGMALRFAFRNHSTDKDLLAIDSIELAQPLIFRDSFDHGLLGAWSSVVGAAP